MKNEINYVVGSRLVPNQRSRVTELLGMVPLSLVTEEGEFPSLSAKSKQGNLKTIVLSLEDDLDRLFIKPEGEATYYPQGIFYKSAGGNIPAAYVGRDRKLHLIIPGSKGQSNKTRAFNFGLNLGESDLLHRGDCTIAVPYTPANNSFGSWGAFRKLLEAEGIRNKYF